MDPEEVRRQYLKDIAQAINDHTARAVEQFNLELDRMLRVQRVALVDAILLADDTTKREEMSPLQRQIRRSTRASPKKPVSASELAVQLNREIDLLSEEGLQLYDTLTEKGQAVRTLHDIEAGTFVAEYRGTVVSWEEGRKIEAEYAQRPDEVGCYMYYFKLGGRGWCIDGTVDKRGLGRYINHSRKKPNLKTIAVPALDRTQPPRVVWRAIVDIPAGSELTYDYGDRDKGSIAANPWLWET